MEKLVYLLHWRDGEAVSPGLVRRVTEGVVPELRSMGSTSEYRFR